MVALTPQEDLEGLASEVAHQGMSSHDMILFSKNTLLAHITNLDIISIISVYIIVNKNVSSRENLILQQANSKCIHSSWYM